MVKPLQGKVAVVTGASRGAGRGIALSLGEAGAVVYVTGRSVRGGPTSDGMPGTVDDTADEVRRRGGEGVAVRCDHAVEEDVAALFARVQKESGRLDILVNNAWAGKTTRPLFWGAFARARLHRRRRPTAPSVPRSRRGARAHRLVDTLEQWR